MWFFDSENTYRCLGQFGSRPMTHNLRMLWISEKSIYWLNVTYSKFFFILNLVVTIYQISCIFQFDHNVITNLFVHVFVIHMIVLDCFKLLLLFLL